MFVHGRGVPVVRQQPSPARLPLHASAMAFAPNHGVEAMSIPSLSVATLGTPRIGPRRELKLALERFWSGACELAAELGFRARLLIIADYRIHALAAWGQVVGLHGVCVEHFLLSPALVDTLRASGLSVSTGTINHPALLAGLLPLGLDAITSDTPAELRAALAASEARARAVHLPHGSTLANPWQRYGARSGGG